MCALGVGLIFILYIYIIYDIYEVEIMLIHTKQVQSWVKCFTTQHTLKCEFGLQNTFTPNLSENNRYYYYNK